MYLLYKQTIKQATLSCLRIIFLSKQSQIEQSFDSNFVWFEGTLHNIICQVISF